jgi:hypothetical protein
VQPDPALDVLKRPLPVHAVVVHNVSNRIIEPEPANSRCHRYAARPVALADLQQVDGRALLRAAGAFLEPLPVAVVANPPHASALSQFAHVPLTSIQCNAQQ